MSDKRCTRCAQPHAQHTTSLGYRLMCPDMQGEYCAPVVSAGAPDDELCAKCSFTLAGHRSNTGVIYPCWTPSGKYNERRSSTTGTPARTCCDAEYEVATAIGKAPCPSHFTEFMAKRAGAAPPARDASEPARCGAAKPGTFLDAPLRCSLPLGHEGGHEHRFSHGSECWPVAKEPTYQTRVTISDEDKRALAVGRSLLAALETVPQGALTIDMWVSADETKVFLLSGDTENVENDEARALAALLTVQP